MSSFDCTSRTTSLQGKLFLEASAGTGKTFAIEQLVTRLLMKGIRLSEILIVTFTRAATRELKQRIRKNIERVLEELRRGETDFDYIKEVLEEQRQEIAAMHLDSALQAFEQAQIFTIHGFCYAMLSKYAFEAGVSVGFSEKEFASHKSTSQNLLRRFMTTMPKEEMGVCQVSRLMRFCRNDVKLLLGRLENSPTSEIDFKTHYRRFLDLLLSLPTICEDDLLSLAKKHRGFCNREKEIHPHFKRQIEDWAKVLQNKDLSLEEFDSLLFEDPFFFQLCEENQLKKAEVVYPPIVTALREELRPILDPKTILAELTEKSSKFAKQTLEKKEIFSPDDLLMKMKSCLQDVSFQKKIERQFKAIIVDEFQDTDSLQWEIFSYFLQVPTLVLVGDPKQSIYSFRGADLNVYFQAEKQLGNRLFLDTNYRSQKSLIDSLNLLFEGGSWLKMQPQGNDLAYHRVHAGKKEQFLPSDGKGAVHFFLAEKASGRSRNFPTVAMEQELIFPYIANEILHLSKDYSFGDMVILIKDRYVALRLENYLTEKNIPCFSKGIKSLVDTQAFSLLEKLFFSICYPNKWGAIKDWLAHPLLEIPITQLEGEPLLDVLKEVAKLHEIIGEGLAPFFHHLFNLSLWGRTFYERSVSDDLMQLIELLIEQEVEKSMSPLDVWNFLKELSTKDPELDERIKKRNCKEGETVTIMTMHMSKGLEFPIVFALGLSYRLSSVPEEIMGQEEEKMRHLYVALTRAKDRVYIPYFVEEECKFPPLGSAAPMELFMGRKLFPDAFGKNLYAHIAKLSLADVEDYLKSIDLTWEVLQQPIICKTYEEKSSVPLPRESPISLSFPKKEVYSFSRLATPHEGEKKELPEGAIPKGAVTGSIVHLIFEKLIERGSFDEKSIQTAVQRTIEKTKLKPFEGEIFSMVQGALNTLLSPFSFTLVDVSPAKMIQEMEFLYLEEDYMKGYIDLFFEIEGKYFLMDWKTNYLEDYSLKGLELAMKENQYDLQASIYAKAARKYIEKINQLPFGGIFYFFLRGIQSETNGIYWINPAD